MIAPGATVAFQAMPGAYISATPVAMKKGDHQAAAVKQRARMICWASVNLPPRFSLSPNTKITDMLMTAPSNVVPNAVTAAALLPVGKRSSLSGALVRDKNVIATNMVNSGTLAANTLRQLISAPSQ